MAVLATSSDCRSAAIASGGQLIAAVQDWREPASPSGEPVGDVATRCLDQAGMRPDDIAVLATIAGEPGDHRALSSQTSDHVGSCVVTASEALVAQAAGAAAESSLLIIVDERVPIALVARHESGLAASARTSPELTNVVSLAQFAARALGWSGSDGVPSLERLAGDAAPEYLAALRKAVTIAPEGTSFDSDVFRGIIEAVEKRCLGKLSDVETSHRLVQEGRAALAASVVGLVGETFAAVAEAHRARDGVTLAGSFFTAAGLNGRLATSIGGSVAIAPVPERPGLTLGAALAAERQPIGPIRHLALGPASDEYELKRVLENCRLEYVYEPEWARLMPRVSALLASGKLVAWYQPPLDFGVRSFGSRSVLCDPSNRYARENINTYLLRQPIDTPLGVSTTKELAQDWLLELTESPFMLLDAAVKPDAEKHLKGAVDRQGRCPVHTSDHSGHPEFEALLRTHYTLTGVPGLINVSLQDADGLPVSDGRGAVRAAFSSAVDVLVMGRFIVSKDYWLLRSR